MWGCANQSAEGPLIVFSSVHIKSRFQLQLHRVMDSLHLIGSIAASRCSSGSLSDLAQRVSATRTVCNKDVNKSIKKKKKN